ncbi:MAG: hypothetical protein ACREDP_25495, partial [Bradyrhizobium sp.]
MDEQQRAARIPLALPPLWAKYQEDGCMPGRLDVSAIGAAPYRVASVEQVMRQDAVIDVRVETLQSIARLEIAWKELEAQATHSFYLSWLWIGTWLRHLPEGAQPHVLVARTPSKIVGLAIICRRSAWSFGLHARARWLLNQTGDVRFDRLFIEYNNILAERSLA